MAKKGNPGIVMGLIYLNAKMAFDLIISLIAVVMLSPFLIIIAVLVRAASPGPALFYHKRAGINGNPFVLYKFRTMNTNTQKYMEKPKPGDKRVTGFGGFLRRTCLDELPQLFNILKGDMSLVGPRPEMPFIAKKYSKKQKQRLKIKPGLTGLWQVARLEGKAGKKHIHEDLKYDLEYIRKMNFFLDLNILAKTAVLVLKKIF